QEVMHTDFLRVALGAIFASVVAKIADQFLFLGVDRDHRLLFGQRRGHLGVDLAELRIPVGVAVALRGLAVALQTVTRLVEQVGDQGATDLVTCACSACARRRTLLQVHRNGNSGSPRVVGSTSASRSGSSVGSPAFARAGSWRSFSCAQLPVAESARTARPAPIPSGLVRSCSALPRSPLPPPRSPHNPRRTPRPPRPDDDPVHQEKGPLPKTAL